MSSAADDGPVVELPVASFLMPPAERWHQERISSAALWEMERAIKRIVFQRRTVRLRTLRHVFVAQEGLVIHPDLSLEDSTMRQHTPEEIMAARQSVRVGQSMGAIPRLQGDVVLCRRPGTGNYGHFLLEMLPMAYVAAQHWPHPARYMIQAVDGALAQVMRDCLDRLGISQDLRIEAGRMPVLVERLVLVDGLTDHGSYVAPLALACLERISAGIPAAPQARLFVSRGAAATRQLAGEAAILLRASGAGYACLAPGGLGFAQQVAAFKGARRVVGVMGATLANLAFAPPGSTAFMLSPANMPDTLFWFICGLRGVRLIDVRCHSAPAREGAAPWDGEVTLDPDDADAIFDAADSREGDALDRVGDLFDAAFYVRHYGDAMPDGADPLEYYFEHGWRTGHDPCAGFSTRRYLAAYPGVADAGMNPLMHYIEHGKAEGRSPVG